MGDEEQPTKKQKLIAALGYLATSLLLISTIACSALGIYNMVMLDVRNGLTQLGLAAIGLFSAQLVFRRTLAAVQKARV